VYCYECVEKRLVRLRGQRKTFYFCPKCNVEVEKLTSNPLRGLWEKLGNFFQKTSPHAAKKADAPKQGGETLLEKIDTLVGNGDLDDALVVIESERDRVSSDINLSERYYNILKSLDKTGEMLEQGRTYLDLLARGSSKKKLCEVYLECISRSSDFSASSYACFKIAGSMIESGNPQGAADVYLGFIKHNPEDPMIPKASFLAANIFNERLLNPQKAVELLEDVIKNYSSHETATYARQYLRQIKR